MSGLRSGDVDHLAKLARIELSQSERTQLGEQLPRIVAFFEAIKSVKDKPVEDSGETTKLENLRPDELGSGPPGLSQIELKKLAPRLRDRQIVVPAVFDN